jgi:tetratricopeptide (TPR) repeat protein
MSKLKSTLLVAALACIAGGVSWRALRKAPPTASPASKPATQLEGYAGSASCRDCHEEFYKKWAGSMHGLAMRPFNDEFARTCLIPQKNEIEIRGHRYQAELRDGAAVVRDRGPDGEKSYPIQEALGGKNVFYFLTPWTRGRLQVLPVAFDARRKEWYDTTGSMLRHFAARPDEALDWKERPFTFNGACYTCHVSQLSKGYSLETDSYRTTWAEPGINCEACHGPGTEHVRAMKAAGDRKPDDLRLIVTRNFTHAQTNDMCTPCHVKMSPITTTFKPGDRFFDHFNLGALDDPDFSPDGRDLGENFTGTLWRISPCASSGQLDCLHCHTSSGRNKHVGAEADNACMPCHKAYVAEPAAHSHHPAGGEASRCVACHMPQTEFARMRRHDHTMLPPAPAATIAFKSPNACNICHTDHDAAWADQWVRKWYPRDYQAPLVQRGSLIDAARKEDWTKVGEMAAYLRDPGHNEIFATSLVRLLGRYPGPEKWPALLDAIRDPSPLVRASAADALTSCPDPRAREALIAATGDAYRLVRIRAAAALAHQPVGEMDSLTQARVGQALAEYEASLRVAPDSPASHYNLGIHLQDRGDLEGAAKAYETALRLQPENVAALVNASIVYAGTGDAAKAEHSLREALKHEPANAEVNFNLGLLLAEKGNRDQAEACLRTALKTNPRFAEAAYNLAVLMAGTKPQETLALCRKAAELRPDQPRYAYTLAFYLQQSGDANGAVEVLRQLLQRHPDYADARALLSAIEGARGPGREGQKQ